MKKLVFILCLIPELLFAQGARIQPGGIPTPVPVYNFSLISNAVVQIVTVMFGNTNGIFISRDNGTGFNTSFVNAGITNSLSVTNGNYINLWNPDGSYLRSNTVAPRDWELWTTNGAITYGQSNMPYVMMDTNYNITYTGANGGKVTAKTGVFPILTNINTEKFEEGTTMTELGHFTAPNNFWKSFIITPAPFTGTISSLIEIAGPLLVDGVISGDGAGITDLPVSGISSSGGAVGQVPTIGSDSVVRWADSGSSGSSFVITNLPETNSMEPWAFIPFADTNVTGSNNFIISFSDFLNVISGSISNSGITAGEGTNIAGFLITSNNNYYVPLMNGNSNYIVSVSNNVVNTSNGVVQFVNTNNITGLATTNFINTTSNILANLSGAFTVLIPSNSTAAQIQTIFNNVTNGALISFQPGDYNLSSAISITNPMTIEGNGAWLHWTNSTALLLTNYMFDTGTNYGKSLVIDNLKFDGGIYEPYGTSAYFDSAHFIPNGLYGDVYWSNRTAIRIEASGNASVTRCTFYGWSGNGILGLSTKDQLSYKTGKLWMYFNTFYTNFCGIMLPGSQFETPGFNNSDSSLWNLITPHYAVVLGNNGYGEQIGIALHTSNTSAQENTLNNDFFGITLNGAGGTHRIFDNNINHCDFGVQYDGSGFVIISGNTMIAIATNSLWADAGSSIDFDNNFIDGGVIATNGCSGFIRDNFLFPGDSWGTSPVVTNYSPAMLVYNNGGMNATNFDNSIISVLTHNLNSPFAGAIPYTPDGTNALWTQSLPSLNITNATFPTFTPASGHTNFVFVLPSTGALTTGDVANVLGNFVSPTNALPDATVVDFSQKSYSTNFSGNVTIASVANTSANVYNDTIWYIKASGADASVTCPAWMGVTTNQYCANHIYYFTNGTKGAIWFHWQAGFMTNAVMIPSAN